MSAQLATQRLIALCGSLRQGSYNRMLLRSARELAPAGLEIVQQEIGDFPLYDGDLEAKGVPAPVARVKAALAESHGLLIVTAEYNHSIPGVLKNALDWLSRGPGLVTRGRPVGVMGASNGMVGTARCQAHLRLVLFTLGAVVMPHPEVLVALCEEKFDASGALTDEKTRQVVGKYLAKLADWVASHPAPPGTSSAGR